MESLGDEFLARSALASNHHGQIRLGNLLDRLEDPPHGRARTDQIVKTVVTLNLFTQQSVLAFEAMSFERT